MMQHSPMNDATQLLTMNDATQAYLACAELDSGGVEGGEALREGGKVNRNRVMKFKK